MKSGDNPIKAEHAKKPTMAATPQVVRPAVPVVQPRQTVFRPFQIAKGRPTPANTVPANAIPPIQRTERGARLIQPPKPETNLTLIYIDKLKAAGVPVFSDSITKAEIKQLIGHDRPLILELGAHHGEDSQAFLNTFSGATVHAFECDPRAITAFQAQVADPRCTLHPCAVAATDGSCVFYQSGGKPRSWPDGTDWDHSGSLLKPAGHLREHTWCTFDRQCVVPTLCLNTWWMCYRDRLPKIVDFIWADMQGAEFMAIDGGKDVFNRTRYFYSEFDQDQMYTGQKPLDEMLAKLGPGWKLQGIYSKCNFLAANTNLL